MMCLVCFVQVALTFAQLYRVCSNWRLTSAFSSFLVADMDFAQNVEKLSPKKSPAYHIPLLINAVKPTKSAH